MRINESKINPLKDFLKSLADSPDDWINLNSNNISIISLYFNSGGVVFETHEEVVKGLEILAEYGIIELSDNKIRITEHGKNAL